MNECANGCADLAVGPRSGAEGFTPKCVGAARLTHLVTERIPFPSTKKLPLSYYISMNHRPPQGAECHCREFAMPDLDLIKQGEQGFS